MPTQITDLFLLEDLEDVGRTSELPENGSLLTASFASLAQELIMESALAPPRIGRVRAFNWP